MKFNKEKKTINTPSAQSPFFKKANSSDFFTEKGGAFFTAPAIQTEAIDENDESRNINPSVTENVNLEEEDDSSGFNSTEEIESSSDEDSIMEEEDEYVYGEDGSYPDEGYLETLGPDNTTDQEEDDSGFVAAPVIKFINDGRTGTARYGDQNIDNDMRPHAFFNGGRTGTVKWGGGGGAGARGNQLAGSVSPQIPPKYESKANPAADAEAWIKIGTGLLEVHRSWLGINPGDQGNGHFVTVAAAARLNTHETLHVTNSASNYSTHLDPMQNRIAEFFGGIKTMHGPNKASAISMLKNYIKWTDSIKAFKTVDITANNPGGTVDTADLASGTYPVRIGPGKVGGKAFRERTRLPSEPNPV